MFTVKLPVEHYIQELSKNTLVSYLILRHKVFESVAEIFSNIKSTKLNFSSWICKPSKLSPGKI